MWKKYVLACAVALTATTAAIWLLGSGTRCFPEQPVAADNPPAQQSQVLTAQDIAQTAEATVAIARESILENPQPIQAVLPTTDPDNQVLPKVQWNYARYAGSAKLVEGNSALNPLNVALAPEQAAALNQIIRAHGAPILAAEKALSEARVQLISRLLSAGRCQLVQPNSQGRIKPSSSPDPELEVQNFMKNGVDYSYALRWGEDPSYDEKRLGVYYAKTQAVGEIKAFMVTAGGGAKVAPTGK